MDRMTAFKVAHTSAEDWAHAAKACTDSLVPLPDGANLGLVYVTDELAEDLASILTYLRQKTGIEDWVGSVGIGVCASGAEYYDEPAVVAMAASLPPGTFRVFPSITETMTQMAEADRDWIAETGATFGLVHGDPGNQEVPDLVSELADMGPAFLVGGLTSSRAACHQVAGRVTGGGLSGVLFAPEVAVATGLSQGCAPLGPSHVVSDCLDNIIIGLDGQLALDVLKEDAGPYLADDLNRAAGYIHVARPIEGSDTGDYMVRNLSGIDPVRGWLAVGDDLEPGDRVLFVRRDPETARDDLRAMLEKLKGRLGSEPRGAVYVSCLARGASMFGAPGAEVGLIQEALGPVPLVGFFASGEISSSRLYTYTGVLSIFL